MKTETAELLAPARARSVFNIKEPLGKVFCTSNLVHVSESEAMTINRGEVPALSLSRTHPSPRFI